MKNKKAFYYSIDALLGALILLAVFQITSNYNIKETKISQELVLSEDIINVLSNIKVENYNSTIVKEMINNGTITNLNNSLLDQIAEFWAKNETNYGKIIFEDFLNKTKIRDYVPQLKFGIFIDGEQIGGDNYSENKSYVLIAHRLKTGFEKAKPISGTSSTAYIKKIRGKKNNKYLFFGGFIGQGNITYKLELPEINTSLIDKIELEGDFGSDFNLYVNNQMCSKFTVNNLSMVPDKYDLTNCSSLFVQGENTIKFIFLDTNISNHYIAGGYLKVSYRTDKLFENIPYGNITLYFPEIEGIVNLYDSIYIPGNLTNLSVHFEFFSNYTTALYIGDKQVFKTPGNNTTIQIVDLNDSQLKNFPIALDYGAISNKTIPIRFYSYEEIKEVVQSGDVDVVLITDLSGSMNYRLDSWSETGVERNCNDPHLYDPDTKRISLAKCLDKEFINIVMNESYVGNRLWLVDFNSYANYYPTDPADITRQNLISHVDSYPNSPSGGTCISCALNLAYLIFNTYSNESRKKFVLFMTDGIPTHCARLVWNWATWSYECDLNSLDYYGDYSWWWGCSGTQSDCSGNDCYWPINDATHAAQRLHDTFNATIDVVGMGPLNSCNNAYTTLSTIASNGGGNLTVSQNASELLDFYRTIAQSIINQMELKSQTIVVKGNLTYSHLYNNSYIKITYEPYIPKPKQNDIIVTLETNKFSSCTDNFNLPNGTTFYDAYVTSYSGDHWTYIVDINNNTFYNLSRDFGTNFAILGDPFYIHVPPDLLKGGNNNITLLTADSPTNITSCSQNNSLIYTFGIKSVTSRSKVLPKREGCNWTIEFEDNEILNLMVPKNYNGSKKCYYTSSKILCDGINCENSEDAYDYATYKLLQQLDLDNDGKVLINFNSFDLEIIVSGIDKVPYLWGPAVVEVRVWR